MHLYRILKVGLMSLIFVYSYSIAGISIDNTRIIFSDTNIKNGQLIGVTSSIQSLTPYIVKAQVLGDIRGDLINTPFSVNPSLFRLEPGTTNQLRILKTGNQTLPQDRESIFYFRTIASPAGKKDNTTEENNLAGAITVSTGTVIKLFYRPSKLPMSQQQAMSTLQFNQLNNVLKITNPSPYYVTLKSLKVGDKSIYLDVEKQNDLLAPYGEMIYHEVNNNKKVTWEAINDYGEVETFHETIQ